MSFKENLKKLEAQLPNHVRVVAVSKTKPIEQLQEAYQAGQRIFGENRVHEIIEKHPQMPGDVEWHMIGHLQSKKVKQVVPLVHMIHSVDSIKLLDTIQKEGSKIDRCIPVLLQVYIAQEETKYGFSEAELLHFFETFDPKMYTHVRIAGLMGMASFVADEQQIRHEFLSLKSTFDTLVQNFSFLLPDFKELSMGMSGDYPIAVELGSTLIRVGTLLFGSRNRV